MTEIVNIQNINPITFELQTYSPEDVSLIASNDISTQFNPETDYLEYFIYDLNRNILVENVIGYPNFTLLDNQVTIDPEADLRAFGFTEGQHNTVYNFLRRRLASTALDRYYIDQISADRTEIRLNTTTIPNVEVSSSAVIFSQDIQNAQGGYLDFYLDFGNNQLVIANNVLLDNSNPNDPTVLIKLYEALPPQFDIKSECWVVEQIAESIAYNISITPVFNIEDDNIPLKGPNYNLSILDQINNSTQYASLSSITATTSATGSGSLRYQLNSLLTENNVELNIDYSNYNNFIHFSSAQTRLENFYYKLSLIEQYTYSASLSVNTTTNYYVSSSNIIYQAKIDEIITNFDGYEYYLYYESGSTAWPKTNNTPPYTNASTVNPGAGYTWFISQLAVAELYDSENNNALVNAIPSYLREDPNNAQYELFVEMIGQHFDNVFSYLQGVTEKYNADNRLNYGVSKDLVADILRDLGIKIYQNNFSTDDLYAALIGITPSGSLYNLPNTTTSLPAPTGLEYITTYVTASATGSLQPVDDINKSIYKRIYHNLPYLLKKKGTIEGLRAIITLYGIPDTILRINEYGGKDKDHSNDWDYWYNQYNYAYTQNGNNYIYSDWELSPEWGLSDNVPATLMFRFKTNGLPTSNIPRSQSLWKINGSGGGTSTIVLTYTGSGYITSSLISSSAGPINPYYQYAKLDFIPDTSSLSTSASVYLPFFDGGWWSVMLTSGSNFTLYAKNSIYNGYDGSQLGFQASSSIAGNNTIWTSYIISFFGESSLTNYNRFSGSFQEIRYYTVPISESVFNDYVMNPNSIEGNGINQGPNQLAFRASLGGELYTGSTSIHPKVTGSWATTSSFASDSNFSFNTTPIFVSNTQSIFFDQPPVGIKNPVADKIKQQSLSLPYSSSLANIPDNTILSNVRSIQQDYAISQSYTKDINYIEVAFSPQNEINDDISSQIGFINIGEYIGDPRLVSSSAETYPPLDALRNAYFEKYTHNYNINDYIRLIKFIDNSLFKMLQDWTPARASLASGIIVKQHLLERNKYPVPQITPNTPIAYYGSGSNNITWNTPFTFQNILVTGSGIQMYTITGSNGGSFPNLQGQTSSVILPSNYNFSITQSWSGTTPSVSGSVPFTQSSQIEFFNGELSGSTLVITDGGLNGGNPFLNIDPTEIRYSIVTFQSTTTSLPSFTDDTPASGIIRTWYNTTLPGIQYMQVNPVSSNGVNVFNTLRDLEEIIFLVSGVKYSFIIQSRVYSSAPPPGYIGPYRPHFFYRILPRPGNTNFGAASATYSNTLTSLSPYVSVPFVNSDYDSLINNATQDRRSIKYMDVDYVDSQLSPINLQGLLSGSATPAPVQDSNYTLGKQINSRYIGKNLQSQEFNQWTPGDVAYGKTPNVSNPRTYFVQFNWLAGTSPEWGNNIADKTQASIRYIVDENGNRTIPINDPEGVNQSIIEQSFAGGNATVQLVNPDAFGVNMNILNGTFSVFKAGKRIAPILYTQTASYYTDPATGQRQVIGFGYTGSILFQDSIIRSNPNAVVAGTVVNDYRLLTYVPSLSTYSGSFRPNRIFERRPIYANNTIIGYTRIFNSASFSNNTDTDITSSSYPQSIQFNRPIQLGASASFITSSTAPFTGSLYSFSFADQATAFYGKAFYTYYFNINLIINWNLSHTSGQGSNLGFTISLQRRGAGLFNTRGFEEDKWNEVAYEKVTLSSLSNSSQIQTRRITLNYTENTPGDGSPFGTAPINNPDYYFKVVVYGFNGTALSGTTTGIVQIADESYFQVRQSPVRDINLPCTQFWMTSSATSSRDTLYARPGTNTTLGLNDVINLQQIDIPNSGFDNILYSFTPQPYDEIRFEGNEDLTFNIVQITQSLTSSIIGSPYQAYTLKLDKDLPFNINTDYFLLRRYIDDPSNIILNVDKPAGGTSGGTLKPEFITTQTEQVVKETITNIVDQ